MLKLPPTGHPVRALFTSMSPEQLLAMTPDELRKISMLPDARKAARKWFKDHPQHDAVNALVLTADGCVKLYSFGPNGGSRMRWNFGRIDSTRAAS